LSSIIKEWQCATHGFFEATHPICPGNNCDSDHVERAFITPVGISKGKYAAFDRGLRESAERMGIRNFKTVRGEEVSFGGRAAQENATLGTEVLWGDQVGKKMGRPMEQQIAQAATPLHLPPDTKVNPRDPHLTHNSGMRNLANDPSAPGILRSPQVLPPAEIKGAKGDPVRPA
jgi:hypothetical protein